MTTTTYNVVGQPTGRSEGPDKVTGRGKYGLDISLPGQLWCKLLRSPFARARLVRIDTSAALALDGVHAVLTGEDVRGIRTARGGHKDEPALCWDEVQFAGDKVAAVVADDEDIAQRAVGTLQSCCRRRAEENANKTSFPLAARNKARNNTATSIRFGII